jgi:membrane protein implicated in regulation of membrane protease activity
MLIYWALTIDGLVDAICLVVNSWVWWDWYRRHDGDDQWKKRRKKALAKIKQVAGKLVVVPVPSPSPA